MADFKVGDTVRLKSGGPLMTISGVGENPSSGSRDENYWRCEWFDKDQKSHMQSFHKESLRSSDDKVKVSFI